MKERGFVISLDAMIALLLMVTMVMAMTLYLGRAQSEAPGRVALLQTASDLATALEKQGTLARAIEQNDTAELRGALNRLPHAVCAQVSVYDGNANATAALSVPRAGCTMDFEDAATLSRSVIANRSGGAGFYTAQVSTGYRTGDS